MSKKGALSISTNAIVVLIIAVVMLGLILALVTTGFGLIEDRFFEAISEEQDPPQPSGTNHVTINKQNIRASAGERIGFRFSVLNIDADNPLTIDAQDVRIECSPDVFSNVFRDDSIVFITTEIPEREVRTMTWAARLQSGLAEDLYLCRLSIDSPTVRGQADFQINIR